MFCFGNDTVIYSPQILADNSNFRKIQIFVVFASLLLRLNEVERKSAKHGYFDFESESFNDVLSPLPSVRLMREEIKLEFSAYFRLAATPAPLF